MTLPDRAGPGRPAGPDGAGSEHRERRVIPFALHQAGEYLFAVIVIFVAVHIGGRPQVILLAGGAALAAMAAVTDGPLGAWKRLSRRAHRVADWVLVGVLALLPVLPGRSLVSILVLEAMAFCQWRMSSMTRYEPRPPRPRRAGPSVVHSTARHLGRRSGAQLSRRAAARRERPPQ